PRATPGGRGPGGSGPPGERRSRVARGLADDAGGRRDRRDRIPRPAVLGRRGPLRPDGGGAAAGPGEVGAGRGLGRGLPAVGQLRLSRHTAAALGDGSGPVKMECHSAEEPCVALTGVQPSRYTLPVAALQVLIVDDDPWILKMVSTV